MSKKIGIFKDVDFIFACVCTVIFIGCVNLK